MVENIENPPDQEAPEYPPENAFDVQSFTDTILDQLGKGREALRNADLGHNALVDWLMKLTAAEIGILGDAVAFLLREEIKIWRPVMEQMVETTGDMLSPGMEILGDLTQVYVNQFVSGQTKISRGEAGAAPGGLSTPAAGMFDAILAPMAGLVGAANPATAGAGEVNSQYALGSIITIHLSTWMVNILSNLTGLGVLKFINSFDDVITSALNSRSLGRIAMRPYLDKYMADPLRRDLNKRLPLAVGSATNLLKSYIRGSLSREQLIDRMRGLGYPEDVIEQLLLDTAKMLSLEAVVWLVNQGKWTEEQAIEHLEQQGYPAALAPAVFELERTSLVRSIWRSTADDLVSLMADRRIESDVVSRMLSAMDFTDDEIRAYIARAALQLETPKRLSLSQVKQLYEASLIDLDYVLGFLHDEGYSDEDADLLALLEFTKVEDRKQRAAELAERRRVAADNARRADVLRDLHQAAEAERLGIPWPPP